MKAPEGPIGTAATDPALRRPEADEPTRRLERSGDDDPGPGLAAGMRLGKYQVQRRLGVGGMGAVYEAIHTGIQKSVALKTLAAAFASEPRAQARFMREAASASRLSHPHVVAVTDFGNDAGVTYLVMELLRGEDLGALIARERDSLEIERAVDVMLEVCSGVQAAHEAGVVHRDLKPQNIFLAETPIGDRVAKVLDFGISKVMDDRDVATLTGTGALVGTTPYLSPEQVAGRDVDARSDQYALGVILYESLVGERPHQGDTLFQIMKSISEGKARPPRNLRPEIPAALEAVILRAMSVKPDARFENVRALGRALLPFASDKRRLFWTDYFDPEAARAKGARRPLHAERTQVLEGDAARVALPATRTRIEPGLGDLAAAPVSAGRLAARARWAIAAAAILVGGTIAWLAFRTREPAPARTGAPASASAPRPSVAPPPTPPPPAAAAEPAAPAPTAGARAATSSPSAPPPRIDDSRRAPGAVSPGERKPRAVKPPEPVRGVHGAPILD